MHLENSLHREISFRDSVAVLPKATDTINILTLKWMKIFKENGQWVAKSKGFDDESGPSTLPFECEDIHDNEDAPRPHLDNDHIGRRPPPPASTRTILIFLIAGSTYLHLPSMAYNMP
ncbi:Uncharacterized protein Adt_39086 [Abeliophyllum distichum]|uniref:Uncharacterized protein n=1 Tax=Abeliophyllum distichum TaxID=126358 RepID=A0ABD1Q4A8_9LAMI